MCPTKKGSGTNSRKRPFGCFALLVPAPFLGDAKPLHSRWSRTTIVFTTTIQVPNSVRRQANATRGMLVMKPSLGPPRRCTTDGSPKPRFNEQAGTASLSMMLMRSTPSRVKGSGVRFYVVRVLPSAFHFLMRWCRRSQGATESESPRRFVAFSLGLGLHGPNLFPQESGFHYAPSPYLAEISDILPDLTVCSGVSHPQVAGGHRAENGSMIPPETSPSRLFQQLFIDDAPAAKQQDSARLRHGRRVMDLVAAPSQRTAA